MKSFDCRSCVMALDRPYLGTAQATRKQVIWSWGSVAPIEACANCISCSFTNEHFFISSKAKFKLAKSLLGLHPKRSAPWSCSWTKWRRPTIRLCLRGLADSPSQAARRSMCSLGPAGRHRFRGATGRSRRKPVFAMRASHLRHSRSVTQSVRA